MAEKLFNVGIKAIIVNDNKVLIMKNTKGFWEVPGGRIDKTESIEQTLKRELFEELPNIKNIVIHEVLGAFRLNKDIKENVSLVLVFYRVTAEFDGDPELSHEHQELMWASKEEALNLVNDSCRQAIENAFERYSN